MPALENTGPPGSLKPFSSQGATALPPPLIQSLGGLDHLGRRHDGVNEIQRLGFRKVYRFTLQQQLHRILRRDDARHVLGAAGAREQADLHFGQTEAGLGIISRNTVVAAQRQLETAAERQAINGSNPRLAAGFDRAEHQREAAALVEQHLVGGDFALVLEQGGVVCWPCLPSSTDRRRRTALPCPR